MGGSAPTKAPAPPSRLARAGATIVAARPHRRVLGCLAIAIIAPLAALIGVLLVVALALIVWLTALAAFVILAVVAGPIHELLRGVAGR